MAGVDLTQLSDENLIKVLEAWKAGPDVSLFEYSNFEDHKTFMMWVSVDLAPCLQRQGQPAQFSNMRLT